MGANIKTDEIEYNFKQDPESNWIALNNTNKPSIILPIDTVLSHTFSQVMYHNIYKYIYMHLSITLIFEIMKFYLNRMSLEAFTRN